jgi:hypothetical protein
MPAQHGRRNGSRRPPRPDSGGPGPERTVGLEHDEGPYRGVQTAPYYPADGVFRCERCSFRRRAGDIVVACRACGRLMDFTDPVNYGCGDPAHRVGYEVRG